MGDLQFTLSRFHATRWPAPNLRFPGSENSARWGKESKIFIRVV